MTHVKENPLREVLVETISGHLKPNRAKSRSVFRLRIALKLKTYFTQMEELKKRVTNTRKCTRELTATTIQVNREFANTIGILTL
jgi:3-methyladenine DNA glycosylase AlkD